MPKPKIMQLVKKAGNREYMRLLKTVRSSKEARKISNRIELHLLFRVFDAALSASLSSEILQHILNRIHLVHGFMQQDRI